MATEEIIDAGAQHPTLCLMQDPMLATLQRSKGVFGLEASAG